MGIHKYKYTNTKKITLKFNETLKHDSAENRRKLLIFFVSFQKLRLRRVCHCMDFLSRPDQIYKIAFSSFLSQHKYKYTNTTETWKNTTINCTCPICFIIFMFAIILYLRNNIAIFGQRDILTHVRKLGL